MSRVLDKSKTKIDEYNKFIFTHERILKETNFSFIYIVLYIVMMGVVGTFIFLSFDKISLPSLLSNDAKVAKNACSSVIRYPSYSHISIKNITQNEIQVKYVNPNNHDYLMGIYHIDKQECIRTR